MKSLVPIFIISLMSFNAFAKSVTLRRIDALEKKVEKLELKVKDGKNKIKETRSISSDNNETAISKEKKKEIMKKIESYQKNRAESQKILDEIMNEDN